MNANSAPAAARSGSFKRLARPLVSPAVFDFWASRVHPLWRWDQAVAQIVDKRAESVDAVTLVLRPNGHWAGFRPGQHVNLTAEVDGARLTRSYSLTGLPGRDRSITVTVKRIAGGRLSTHLHERAKVGDVLGISPAHGGMRLPAEPAAATLFLAAGSGITPLLSLLRALAAQGMPGPATLLYWGRSRNELCFVDEFKALARRHANFEPRFFLTREPALAPAEFRGRLDAAALQQVPELSGRHVYACGPGGFTDTAASLLDGRVARFQSESFTLPPRDFGDRGNVQVQLSVSGRSLSLPRGISLLQALEAQGLKPAQGCRMGICNTCACGKSAGTTRHLPSGALQGEPTDALKLCISSAASDLVLEL